VSAFFVYFIHRPVSGDAAIVERWYFGVDVDYVGLKRETFFVFRDFFVQFTKIL